MAEINKEINKELDDKIKNENERDINIEDEDMLTDDLDKEPDLDDLSEPPVEELEEISQEECVCMRSIQISIKQARTRIAQLGETYPILFHLLEESEYISILSKKEEEPDDSCDKDEGWETLF